MWCHGTGQSTADLNSAPDKLSDFLTTSHVLASQPLTPTLPLPTMLLSSELHVQTFPTCWALLRYPLLQEALCAAFGQHRASAAP